MTRHGPFSNEAEARRFLEADYRDPAWLAARGAMTIAHVETGIAWALLPDDEPLPNKVEA